jgi:starch-binding outer membrane protein, SusD/RagB family
MKNIKILIILAFGALVLNSCSGFLDSKPVIGLTDETFYKTKGDAELAIVGCYDGMQQLYDNGVAFPLLSEVLSDNCYGGTGSNDGFGYQVLDQFDLSVSPSDGDQLNNNWTYYYKAIYRMNMLLSKMEQINWDGDEAYRTNIEAQARFLRAYCYFDMVRIWEKVPLILEPTMGNVGQASVEELYATIASDLKFVAENGSSVVEAGRVNKYAAKALLARVYLFYTGYYGASDLAGVTTKAEALQGLEDVVSSAKYGLVSNFKNLWPGASTYIDGDTISSTYIGKDNVETVFAIKYNITSNWDGNTDGNHWMIMNGLRSYAYPPYAMGWGACTVLPGLYNAYEALDTRRDASIISFAKEKIDFDNSNQREYTGYSTKKYIPIAVPSGKDLVLAEGAKSFMTGQYQDYVAIRYADVLLMAAELGSSNAQSYFDLVRARAGLTTKTVSQANIMEERRLEFAFEGIRYWDLLRQGVSVAAAAIAIEAVVKTGGVDANKVISSSKITTTRGFQMIPSTPLTLSAGKLIQNAGWE